MFEIVQLSIALSCSSTIIANLIYKLTIIYKKKYINFNDITTSAVSPVIFIPPPLLPATFVLNTISSPTFSVTSATLQLPIQLTQTDTPAFLPTTITSGWEPVVIVMVVLVMC